MFEVKAIIRPQRLEAVRMALRQLGDIPGVTVSKVHAFARSHPREPTAPTDALEVDLVKLETVVPEAVAHRVGSGRRTAPRDALERAVAAVKGSGADLLMPLSALSNVLNRRAGRRWIRRESSDAGPVVSA